MAPRWYDKLGRFLSADTIVPNTRSNPQNLRTASPTCATTRCVTSIPMGIT